MACGLPEGDHAVPAVDHFAVERAAALTLLQCDASPPAGPWICAFIHAIPGGIVRQPLAVADLLNLIQEPSQVRHVGFAVLRVAPDTGKVAAFGSAMLQAAAGFPAVDRASTRGGFVLWLDALDSFDVTKVCALSLPGFPVAAHPPYSYCVTAGAAQRLYDAGGGEARVLYGLAPAAGTISLADGGADGLAFSLGGAMSLGFGAGAASTAVTLSSLTVALGGAQAGCIGFKGAVAPGLRAFELGFQHALVPAGAIGDTPGVPSRLFHPLLDRSEILAGATVQGWLDPLSPTLGARNVLTLTPQGGSIATAYRTVLNKTIRLNRP